MTILPIIFLTQYIVKEKFSLKNISSFLGLSIFYIVARVLFFGFASTGDYNLVFNLKSVVNNYFWYLLWSLGFPEDLVNYDLFNTRTIINLAIFDKYTIIGLVALSFLFVFLLFFIFAFFKALIKTSNKQIKIIGFLLFWFLTTLGMVVFYPFHKFIYSLTVPLVAISILLAIVSLELYKKAFLLYFMFIVVYFASQLFVVTYMKTKHWTIVRGELAKISKEFLDNNVKGGETIFVREDFSPVCWLKYSIGKTNLYFFCQ